MNKTPSRRDRCFAYQDGSEDDGHPRFDYSGGTSAVGSRRRVHKTLATSSEGQTEARPPLRAAKVCPRRDKDIEVVGVKRARKGVLLATSRVATFMTMCAQDEGEAHAHVSAPRHGLILASWTRLLSEHLLASVEWTSRCR